MSDPERMVEPGVCCARVDKRCEGKLADSAKSLNQGRVDYAPLIVFEMNISVNWIADIAG